MFDSIYRWTSSKKSCLKPIFQFCQIRTNIADGRCDCACAWGGETAKLDTSNMCQLALAPSVQGGN